MARVRRVTQKNVGQFFDAASGNADLTELLKSSNKRKRAGACFGLETWSQTIIVTSKGVSGKKLIQSLENEGIELSSEAERILTQRGFAVRKGKSFTLRIARTILAPDLSLLAFWQNEHKITRENVGIAARQLKLSEV